MIMIACIAAIAGCGGGGNEEPASLSTSASPAAVSSATALGVTPDTERRTVAAVSGSTAAELLDPAAGFVLPAATPAEKWSAAAATAQSSAAWSGWVASRRASAQAWASTAHERADLIGGWIHDYVDPTTGIPLTWTPTTPEPPDGLTDAEIKFKRAWVAHMRGYNIRQMLEAARLARLGEDGALGEWAASQLDFYASNYLKWPQAQGQGRSSRMFWNGLDEATASFSLVDAARLLSPLVSPARAEAWRVGLFMPLAANLKQPGLKGTNINLWHAAAVARIGMRFGDEELVRWGLAGEVGTRATLAYCVTSDNIWNEGSFSYNAWMADALGLLVVGAGLEGRLDAVTHEREALGRILLAPLELRFDNGRLPTPGDATPISAIDTGHLASLYRALPTWWGLNRAKTLQTWDTLLDPPVEVSTSPSLPAVVTRDFPSVRMGVLRAGTWQAFVHYGQARWEHHQHEALTFELYHGERPLSTDPGTVAYGSPLHENWFRRGASHNVPLIDGEGQANWSAGDVMAFDAAPVARLHVRHVDYRPGVSAERELSLTADGLTEVTTLRAADGQPRRLGVAFLTGCTLSAGGGLSPLPDATPPANSATAYWQDLVSYRASGSFAIHMDCGGATYLYRVEGPAEQTVFLGRAPTAPMPTMRSVLYFDSVSDHARFRSAISAR